MYLYCVLRSSCSRMTHAHLDQWINGIVRAPRTNNGGRAKHLIGTGGDQPTTDHFGQGESKNTKRRHRDKPRGWTGLGRAGPGCEIDHRLTPPLSPPGFALTLNRRGRGVCCSHTHKSRVCLYNTYLLNRVTVCLLGSNRGWREEGRRGKPPPPFSSGQLVDKHPIFGIVPPPPPSAHLLWGPSHDRSPTHPGHPRYHHQHYDPSRGPYCAHSFVPGGLPCWMMRLGAERAGLTLCWLACLLAHHTQRKREEEAVCSKGGGEGGGKPRGEGEREKKKEIVCRTPYSRPR